MAETTKQSLMIITNYFPPEIGAASNRIFHLAEGLKSDYKVRVVTPLPNYPTGKIFKSYKYKAISKTDENGISVHRLWVYASISKNKFLRLLAMLSYSLSLVFYFLSHRKPDKVIIQSPPLLVAFTCLLFLKSKKRTLILNVSDLWPRAGLELGALKANWFYNVLKRIERFNYFRADIILGQSLEILKHISIINSNAKTLIYRNYPIVGSLNIKEMPRDNERLKIVYAGLLGVAQGILKLCQNLDFSQIELHLYGSGAEETEIISFLKKNKDLPIFFHGKLDRGDLHNTLLEYDLAIIPLVKRIYGSVPSKIFEYSKLGLPLLYFGGGEGEEIVQKYKLGWVAECGNYQNLNSVITSINPEDLNLDFKQSIQKTAMSSFSFEQQLENLKQVL
jgi:glycosyltransferase involved in cell wall biosynthesis